MNNNPNHPSLDLSNAIDVVCDKCGNSSFNMIFKIKKLSSKVSPNGQGGFLPLQTYSCSECGHINKTFTG